ncbi:MAG: DUF3524 domain-containing protein [Deltaproteobacteria bacterium]|nr:DUF3524 domain-containing protein [Deltaproteobacteria bacterium]
MKILFLEPFFGGSHRDFAEGLVAHSRHEIDLITLPSRFWKWRMRGASLYFIKQIQNLHAYDALITTDLMSLADFKALTGSACPPALVYFHENQLTYPLAPGETMDYQFGFTDITTCLTADRVLFNSRFHLDAFFSALPNFLNMMPEFRPRWVVEAIRSKSGVCYPGCRFPETGDLSRSAGTGPPLIIWNHRWEFDKNPEGFFNILDMVLERGLEFRLALLGENFQTLPKAFISARDRYGDRIVRYGYVKSRNEYQQWLSRGDIVISTATQENFGISVVEAIRYGCIPLLPNRLAYPEVLPEAYHDGFLYGDDSEAVDKLCRMIADPRSFEPAKEGLSNHMGRFSWERMIGYYDEELETMVR